MRSRLLRSADYDALLTLDSLDHVLASLAAGPYGPDIEAAMTRAIGLRRLDDALRTHLASALRAMRSFYEEEAGRRVELLLDRWDRHNLRTLLRLPEPPGDVADVAGLLVPAGRLDAASLFELAGRPDVRSRVDLMVAWDLPSPDTARRLLHALGHNGNAAALEQALDEAFAARLDDALAGDTGLGAVILRTEIDERNLLLALRRRAARLEDEPGWDEAPGSPVPGGRVPERVWHDLTGIDDPAEVVAEAVAHRLLPGWQEALARWAENGDLGVLAHEVHRVLGAAANGLFSRGDPLSFDIPVAFAWAKEAEVRNLRVVGRAVVHGLTARDLEPGWEAVA
jgi:V/A-type H+-transporting ATPase subunit C